MQYKSVSLAVALIFCASGCATTYDTWQEAFAAYDKKGCKVSMWNTTQASHCLSYIAATYCDQRFGLRQSWKNQQLRSSDWVRCAQDRYDYVAGQYMAQRQAMGNAMSQSGQTLMNSSAASPSTSSTGRASGYLTGDSQSGFNKICYYNVNGSTYTKNVGATELCPLTAEF